MSHSYVSQLSSESDLENLKFPDIRVDEAKDKKRWEKVSEMVSGILPVRLTGVRMFHCGIWDDLVEAIGTDNFFFFLRTSRSCCTRRPDAWRTFARA